MWVGTPYVDQAALKGIGCDCAGLLRGVGDVIGVHVLGADDYPKEASGAELLAALESNCDRLPVTSLEATCPGTIVAMNMRSAPGPHHLLIRSEAGVIHAFGPGVREEPLFGFQRFHSAWWHREVIPWRKHSQLA